MRAVDFLPTGGDLSHHPLAHPGIRPAVLVCSFFFRSTKAMNHPKKTTEAAINHKGHDFFLKMLFLKLSKKHRPSGSLDLFLFLLSGPPAVPQPQTLTRAFSRELNGKRSTVERSPFFWAWNERGSFFCHVKE